MDVRAHLSPRLRVGLESSPTFGGGIVKSKMGRRVVLISDILELLEVFWEDFGFKLGKGTEYWNIWTIEHLLYLPLPVPASESRNCQVLQSGSWIMSRVPVDTIHGVTGRTYYDSKSENEKKRKKRGEQTLSQSYDVSAITVRSTLEYPPEEEEKKPAIAWQVGPESIAWISYFWE